MRGCDSDICGCMKGRDGLAWWWRLSKESLTPTLGLF
jgi:hypothetical protein